MLGPKGDRTAANNASAPARAQRSDTIVRILLEDEAYRALSHQARADLLNRRKTLSGWGRPWARDSVKRLRKDADQRIREWVDWDTEALPALQIIGEKAPEVIITPDAIEAAAPENDDTGMRKLPTFGML